MGHSMAYGICGASFSNFASLVKAGFVDYHLVVPGGGWWNSSTASSFVSTCNSYGVSPILNNGNDGVAGWNGSDSYYTTVAGAGFHAAGGESEQYGEIASIMNHLTFMNYGGEWNCCTNLSDLFCCGHAMDGRNAAGYGIASYLETYVGVCGVYLCSAATLADAVVNAHNHGCKEAGIMIGAWMGGHGVGAQPYIDMINTIESRGVTCSGVVLWWGEGIDAWTTYTANGNNGIISSLQAIWPANMTPLKSRWGGAGPTGGGGGGTTTPAGPAPLSPNQYQGNSEIDIIPYLTKAHNGQPTSGMHYVEVQPIAGQKGQLTITAKVRDWQPDKMG